MSTPEPDVGRRPLLLFTERIGHHENAARTQHAGGLGEAERPRLVIDDVIADVKQADHVRVTVLDGQRILAELEGVEALVGKAMPQVRDRLRRDVEPMDRCGAERQELLHDPTHAAAEVDGTIDPADILQRLGEDTTLPTVDPPVVRLAVCGVAGGSQAAE